MHCGQYKNIFFRALTTRDNDDHGKERSGTGVRTNAPTRDEENTYLQLDSLDEDPMQDVQGHSISCRTAIGPQQGRKVFTLQTLPAQSKDERRSERVAKLAGFSLHAGVCAETHQLPL